MSNGRVSVASGEGAHAAGTNDVPQPGDPGPELPAERYLDREESWLRFNERVLELAEDPAVPLLDRVRFTAIFAGNLDEFFMVRVAGLVRRMAAGLPVEGVGGRRPTRVLEGALEQAGELTVRHAACYSSMLLPALAAQGIEILRWKELSGQEQATLRELFRERIYPVLTPLVVDPAHPFPYISGLSLSLAVMVADPETGETMFARVKVPPLLPRFLTVSTHRFVPLEDVIAAHLTELFAGLDVLEHHAFRVTRIRDLEVDEDITEDLLQALERELQRHRFEPAVRLEVEESMSSDVLERLVTELRIDRRAVYRLPGPLDLSGLSAIADLDLRDLKYPAFFPAEQAVPPDTDIFTVLAERDRLVHHPYDSFTTSVERLIVEAAADPGVLAIKQTLYRTSGESPIVDALIDAAEAGKQVVVVVEIKARFDERANIAWARKLEEAGCHVVYGFVGLKTHAKVALVVREEPDGSLRRYCHIGTGNYHPTTARLYEDFGLLTADPAVGEDVTDLFNNLTGYSRNKSYRRLLLAPQALRAGLVDRINRQAERARAGLPSLIQMKCNALTDEAVMDALYRASQAGVPVDLWIRGICSLRPGVPGLSESIRVRSVLGRFLEHSRIYAFGPVRANGDGDPDGGETPNGEKAGRKTASVQTVNAETADAEAVNGKTAAELPAPPGQPPGQPGQHRLREVWLGSSDLMHRNLDRRVELLVRVGDRGHAATLSELFAMAMDEGTASWWLGADGGWTRHHLDSSGAPLLDLQAFLAGTGRPGAEADGRRDSASRPAGGRRRRPRSATGATGRG
jgi:polyphosphate kinase